MFDIRYKLRNNIKGQVLVDFVVEFTPKPRVPIGICQVMVKKWQVYVDDASNIRVMQRGRVEAESVTHNYYNSSTKPKFYKNTRLVGKIIEKTSLTNFY